MADPSTPPWLNHLLNSSQRYHDDHPPVAVLRDHAKQSLEEFLIYFESATEPLLHAPTPIRTPKNHPYAYRWKASGRTLSFDLEWIIARDPIAIAMHVVAKNGAMIQPLWSQPITNTTPIDFTPTITAWTTWLDHPTTALHPSNQRPPQRSDDDAPPHFLFATGIALTTFLLIVILAFHLYHS